MTLIVKCPTCGKLVPWEEQRRWRPFCSERCKLIDLGEWASGNRAVPGEPAGDISDGDGQANDSD